MFVNSSWKACIAIGPKTTLFTEGDNILQAEGFNNQWRCCKIATFSSLQKGTNDFLYHLTDTAFIKVLDGQVIEVTKRSLLEHCKEINDRIEASTL